MSSHKGHHHEHDHSHYHIHTNERSTRLVVALSFFTMLGELYWGYSSGSRALIMDGWHMLSHVLVLGLAWLAYYYIGRKGAHISHKQQHRVIALSGFASAIVMLLITTDMVYEIIERFSYPEIEVSTEALTIACIALVVNGASAYFLHREEEKMDVNLRAAYLHVVSDVVLSFFAIISLVASKYFDFNRLDTVLSVIGALVILRWSIGLIRKSWREVIGVT